ncbi:MAG: hypothetical protein H6850_01985 [Alphaproteobacteria bacterium]|nr:MAG: hypothetical protein H6850_01985 [Alphaproteobacteria bacterium]
MLLFLTASSSYTATPQNVQPFFDAIVSERGITEQMLEKEDFAHEIFAEATMKYIKMNGIIPSRHAPDTHPTETRSPTAEDGSEAHKDQ